MSILTEVEAKLRELVDDLLGRHSHGPDVIEQHGAALTQLADKVAAAANPAPVEEEQAPEPGVTDPADAEDTTNFDGIMSGLKDANDIAATDSAQVP